VAILPLDNLTTVRDLDWAGRALQMALEAQLASTEEWRPSLAATPVAAHSAGARRMLGGYLTNEGGRLRVFAILENLETGKAEKTFEVTAPAGGGVLEAAKTLAGRLSAKPRRLPTNSEKAARHFAMAMAMEPARALEELQAATDTDPSFAQAWLARARLIERRDPAAAQEVIAKAMRHREHFAEAERRRLEFAHASHTGDARTRLQALEALHKADPLDTDTLLLLAQTRYQRREFSAAAAMFRKTADLQPGNGSIWNQLGYSQALDGDLEGALRSMSRYRQLAPDEANPLDSSGEVCYLRGRFADAEKWFLEAASKNAAFIGGAAYLKAAQARLAQGNLSGADEMAGRYFEFLSKAGDPRHAFFQAKWMFLTGRRRDALARLENLKQKPALAARISTELTMMYRELGRPDEARAAAAAAVRMLGAQRDSPTVRMATLFAQPSAPPAAWRQRAARLSSLEEHAPLRAQLLGYALLFDRHWADALPLLLEVYDALDPLTGDENRELAAWAADAAGHQEQAANLLGRFPAPWNNLLSPALVQIYPKQFYLRAEAAARKGNQQEAKRHYDLFVKLSGDLPDGYGCLDRAAQALKR
jgi:Flp pilus assembly protein TadD